MIIAQTSAEKTEYINWMSQKYFPNSKSLVAINGLSEYQYVFSLTLENRSMSPDAIKQIIKNNLPKTICSNYNCDVYVEESGFLEKDGSWDGYWSTYTSQQNNWTNLYKSELKNNNHLITYIQTHGAPTYQQFGIYSDTVKNSKFNSLIYEIEACNTGNYLVNDYLAGDYLFYTNSLVISAYSIPFVMTGTGGYYEDNEYLRFLNIKPGDPVINALFLYNYGNYIYLGDPLLKVSNN